MQVLFGKKIVKQVTVNFSLISFFMLKLNIQLICFLPIRK